MSNIKCPTCKAASLEELTDGKIICLSCKNYCVIMSKWIDPKSLNELV